jgi:BMFP domain-containing protein YqiC
LTPRAILQAVGEVLAEQRNTIAALQARVEALERADPAKRLKAVQSAPGAMIA